MNRKRNRIMLFSGATVLLALLLFGIKFLLDSPYRNQLPAYPDFSILTKPEQEQIKEANRQATISTTADNIGKLGMAYYSCADYERASRCYQLAMRKDSRKWVWTYYLGYMNLERGESNAAIGNFSAVLEKDPANLRAMYYTGEAYQGIGSIDRAKKMFKKIIEANSPDRDEKNADREHAFPLKVYAMFQLARMYMSSDRADSAETMLKAIIENTATFGPAYRTLGNVYAVKGQPTLAGNYTVRANDLADYTPVSDSLVDKIALLSRSDQYLLKQLEDAVRSGNHRWALVLCDHALKYYPDNKYLISNAIVENFRQGNDKAALAYLDKHFHYFSNDAKELMDMTDLLYDKGHGEEAMKYFNQVRKLMPQNSSLAAWLYDRGKKEEAVVMMNELHKNNPGNIKILADIIRLLLNMGDEEMAKEYMEQLNRLSPASAEAIKIKGLIAEKQGDLRQASAAYEEAYKLDPKDLIFIKEMIDLYIRQKDWAQALRHFNLALQTYPNEPSLLEGFGRILISCPDPSIRNVNDGIACSQRAFISYKSPYKIQLSAGKNLATAYVLLGDKKNAVKYINQTIDLARKGNQAEEYVAYFNTLVSRQ